MLALLFALLPILSFITVLKDVLLGGMAMEVQVQKELFLICVHQLLAKFLNIVHTGMQGFARLGPFPIEVTGGERAAVVAIDDSVNVYHGYDIELKMVFEVANELLFLRVGRVEEGVQQALHHP
jgi:hypothetical protein